MNITLTSNSVIQILVNLTINYLISDYVYSFSFIISFSLLFFLGNKIDKKISSIYYYTHRLMIRHNQDNYILPYRQLFHQYIVDMYAKIESERLRFIRYNQAKLRSGEYIHLRDAIAGNIDGNLNPNDIGNAFILPSSYIGSPWNMQEYIQDAMTYIRNYGRPGLFNTFTCNSNWEEVQTLRRATSNTSS